MHTGAVSVMREREDMSEGPSVFATAPGGVIGREAEDLARPLTERERRALLERLRSAPAVDPEPGRVRRAG